MYAPNALEPRLYFSYRQFFVYDSGIKAPGCLWTPAHFAQGFARRESNVSFGTILESGHADVRCYHGPFRHDGVYERVIAVPFHVLSGKAAIDGPDEVGVGRAIELRSGHYRIVAAQRVVDAGEEVIDLFIEEVAQPLGRSTVILADDLLSPPEHLVETAEIA